MIKLREFKNRRTRGYALTVDFIRGYKISTSGKATVAYKNTYSVPKHTIDMGNCRMCSFPTPLSTEVLVKVDLRQGALANRKADSIELFICSRCFDTFVFVQLLGYESGLVNL